MPLIGPPAFGNASPEVLRCEPFLSCTHDIEQHRARRLNRETRRERIAHTSTADSDPMSRANVELSEPASLTVSFGNLRV